MMRSLALSVIILASSLGGCSKEVVKVMSVELPLPPPLKIQMTDKDLNCVADSTYDEIVKIDKRRQLLREIIQSTQE